MVESRLEGNLRSEPTTTNVSTSDAAAKRTMPRLPGMKRPRSGVGGVGGAGGRRGQKNDSEKPPSNPRGWPDRCKEADLEERPHRRIILNAEQELWFCNNYVRTSKYTLLDFLPRFLMEEFHPRRKMANVYFLVLASLQTIQEISNTYGVPTILLPLSIVVLIGAFFAILEDVARHRADAKANASPTRVLELKRSSGRFRRVAWSDVHVGDFLLLKNRESVPADLLVIATHEPNPRAKTGMCYVETKSLDGETNLKIRQAISPTMGLVSSPRDAAALRGFVEMEHPNKLIENFNGSIEVEGAGAGGDSTREAIQTRNLLLRGCVLRNTRWIVGLVLNTGPDTKIIMSSLEPPQKSSRLEQRTNVEVWRIVRLLCLVCLLGAVGSLAWNLSFALDHVYLEWDLDGWRTNVKEATIQFFYLFLLLGNFIPVSLYVSMTIVKFCQSFFMKQDLDMYHEESDTPALVRTMALNEELGQVSHVFSDKTGTLTQNIMEFRKCCIGGVSYGRGVTDIGRAVAAENGEEISKEDLEAELMISSRPAVPHVRFYDPRMEQDLQGAAGVEQRALLQDFFVALAVCHTVIPERGAPRRRRRATSCTGRNDATGHSHRPRTTTNDRLSGGFPPASVSLAYDSEVDANMSERPLRERSMRERSMMERSMMDESGVRTDDEGDMEEEKWAEGQSEAEDEEQPKLSASSPDDEALVLGARFFGMEFRDRVGNSACIRRSGPFVRGVHGQAALMKSPLRGMELHYGDGGPSYVDERYEVLRVLDFTSARKRMSVIVRDPQGRVRVLCKGADSVMIPRLAPIKSTAAMGTSPEGAESRKKTLEHMDRYAREGLRTLLVGSAELDRDWFVEWDKRFEAASTDLSEVDKKKRGLENEIDTLMNQVEVYLRLLGCTAIEDKLQDGVGRTIRALQSAGVKVWMLTGDKEETAVNIGVACQLLPPESVMERIVVNMDPQTGCQDVGDVRNRLEEEVRRIDDERPRASLKGARPRALVIDGQALNLATQPLCRDFLAELAMNCAAVIGCRVSPDQKREVVALVRETRPESRTLAIGDGANDVAMIQGAHIGIGISGQEGVQAVNSSDFAIAQFQFLRKLMLFHGRQNYRRMSKLVVYTFYKNVLMAVPMAWYVVMNGYSGQKFYTEVGIQMYNLLFTTLPVLFLGCFDRDVTLEDTERFPGLYVLGINDVFFNPKVFWGWMTQAIAEAAVITFVPLMLVTGGPEDFGTEQSFFFYGGTTFTLVVLVANSKVLWLQYRWTWWAAALVILSILAWFGVACAATTFVQLDYDFFMVYFRLLANPTFWAVCALCVTAVAMRDLTWKFFHRWWQPKLHHVILEVEAKGRGEMLDLSSEECVEAAARGGIGSSGVGARGIRGRNGGIRVSGEQDRRGSGGTDLITAHDSGIMVSAEVHPHAEPRPAFFSAPAFDGHGDDSDTQPPILGQLRASEGIVEGVEGDHFVRGGRRKRSSAAVTPAISRDVDLGGIDVNRGVDVEPGGAVDSEVVDTNVKVDVEVEVELEVEKREGEMPSVDAVSVWTRSSPVERGLEQRGGVEPSALNTRSWSWKPILANVPSPTPIARSRSDQVKMRSQGTRSAQSIITPSYQVEGADRGNTYHIFSGKKFLEAPPSLESDMILDYVELPQKKTSTFWEAPGPTLDRFVRRRDTGFLSTGYGRWKQKNAAGAVGPRLSRETTSHADGSDGAESRGSPGSSTARSQNRHFSSPPLLEPTDVRRSKDLSDAGVGRDRGSHSRSSRSRSSGKARSDNIGSIGVDRKRGLSATVAAPPAVADDNLKSSAEGRVGRAKSTADIGRSEGLGKQGSFVERFLGSFGGGKT